MELYILFKLNSFIYKILHIINCYYLNKRNSLANNLKASMYPLNTFLKKRLKKAPNTRLCHNKNSAISI